MYSFSSAAEELVHGKKSQPIYMCVFNNWVEIVGERFALISKPHSVYKQNKEKILKVEVVREMALEVQHESAAILDAVNNAIGHKYFSRVKITVSSQEKIID